MTSLRRKSGGYARGDDTRARVVASALKVFGRRGFDGASTRNIALDAGVNAPSLQYYFDSKEGLYLACVEDISARLWACAGSAIAQAERMLKQRASVGRLIDAYCSVQASLADFMLSGPEPSDWLLILAREQAGFGTQSGFKLMYNEVNRKLLGVNSAVVGRLLRQPAANQETRVRAMTLSGQLLMFMFMKRTVLTSLGWSDLSGERADLIKRIIRENTEVLLRTLVEKKSPRETRTRRIRTVQSKTRRARSQAK